MIIIASHVLFDKKHTPYHGTGVAIGQYLQHRKIDFIFIKHPIRAGFATRTETFEDGKLSIKILGVRWLPFVPRIIQDFIITASVVFGTDKITDLFIGIDPLNAFFALQLKRLGKIKKVVFYTADWTPTRFKNIVLNKIYHAIDRYCIRNADEVWNVSKRITELRRKQGVEKDRNKLLPNTPFITRSPVKSIRKIRMHDIVNATSYFTSDMDYEALFRTVDILKNRFPDIRLLLIGYPGEYGEKLKEEMIRMRLSKNIKFLGLLPHNKVIDIISKSGIGLAMYKGTNSWDEYCDSMKVREYLACGTPVIMTSISPASRDVTRWKAGIVLDDVSLLDRKIKLLFSNPNIYSEMRRNAIYLGRKYDFSKILESLLTGLLGDYYEKN